MWLENTRCQYTLHIFWLLEDNVWLAQRGHGFTVYKLSTLRKIKVLVRNRPRLKLKVRIVCQIKVS